MLYSIVFLMVITQAIQIQPQPTKQESDTILDKMRQELTSPLGNCSFPPEEVLTIHNVEAFTFLEKCNKKISNSSSYKDEDTLLCMGLFDIGLRICSIRDEATFKSITRYVPHNAVQFQKLLTEGFNRQEDFCTALNDAVVEPQTLLTQKWNLKHVLQKSDKACSRLCYDYNGEENVFCQLILWGSYLLGRSAIGDHSMSGYDIKAADSASPIVENHQVFAGVEQLASKPSDIRRLGQPQSNFQERKPAFSHKLINSSQEVNKIDSEHVGQGVAQRTQSIGTGTDTNVEVSHAMSPSIENSGSVNNGDKPADLPEVQIIESGASMLRTVQKQSATSDDVKTDTSHADPKKKLTNPVSAGSFSTGTVSKADLDKATGPSQEDRPTVEKDDSQEVNPQHMSKSSVLQAVSKSGSTSVSTPNTVDVVAPDVPMIPKEGEDAGLNEEPGVEQIENDEQQFPVDDDEDSNLANGDLVFEPSKGEPFGNEKSFAKQPQEEMTNGNAYMRDRFVDSEDSHFFSYFLMLIGISIIGYLVFHNKQKILALAVEGRARRGSRRRPNTANYHKLDSNLEEAVSSPCNTSSSHVIY